MVAGAGEARDVAISPRLHDEYGSGSLDLEEHRTQRDIGHTVYGIERMDGRWTCFVVLIHLIFLAGIAKNNVHMTLSSFE